MRPAIAGMVVIGLLMAGMVVVISTRGDAPWAVAGDGAPLPAAAPTVPPATATSGPAGEAPAVSAAAARGAQAFTAWCNSCHPGGQAANGPALWGRGRALTPAQIRAQIRETPDERERGRFATLPDDRLDDIVVFILEQQRGVDGAAGQSRPAPRSP
jgi:mono/diheme cytochrome c family protein